MCVCGGVHEEEEEEEEEEEAAHTQREREDGSMDHCCSSSVCFPHQSRLTSRSCWCLRRLEEKTGRGEEVEVAGVRRCNYPV